MPLREEVLKGIPGENAAVRTSITRRFTIRSEADG